MRLWVGVIITVCVLAGTATAQVSPVQVSFLPSGRAGVPDAPITIFGTVVNSSDEDMDCAPQTIFMGELPEGVTGLFRMSAMDGGAVVGGPNQTVTVPDGGSQDYLVEITVDADFYGRASAPRIRCVGATEVGNTYRYPLVNDILLDVSSSAQPDIIMIGDTLSRDDVARVGTSGPRGALLSVAAVNIGDPGADLEVFPAIAGFPALNRATEIMICEIDAAGACMAPEGESVTVAAWPTNEIRFFAIRARFPREVGAPFYPDLIRLFAAVRETSADGGHPKIAGLSAPQGRFDIEIGEVAATSGGIQIGRIPLHRDDPADPEAEPPVHIMSCALRFDVDTSGALTGMQNGRIVLQPDGLGGAMAAGWIETFDGRHAISWEQPSWDSALAAGRQYAGARASARLRRRLHTAHRR